LPRQARDNPYYREESTQKRTAFELLQEVTEDERKALVELLPVYQDYMQQARKRHFLSHLYIKCIILPRQPRDKHRENSKNDRFLAEYSHLDAATDRPVLQHLHVPAPANISVKTAEISAIRVS